MQTDPHADLRALGPGVRRDRTLGRDGGRRRVARGVEDDEEAVTGGLDLASLVRREGLAEKSAVVGSDGDERVGAEAPDEVGRPLDVAEEECDRPARQRAAHGAHLRI